MKNRYRLLIFGSVFLGIFLVSSIGSLPTNAIFIIEDPIDPIPTYGYRIYGYVKDIYFETPIEGATANVYKGTTYIGRTTTSSTGLFDFRYSSIEEISSFEVLISKSGYNSATKTQTGTGLTFNMGTILMDPIVPPKQYSIHGYVKDVNTGYHLASALVEVYSGTTLLETVSTDINGYFNAEFLSYSTYTSFVAKVIKSGYVDNEVVITGTGTDFNAGAIYMYVGLSYLVITKDYFNYISETFDEYWSLESTSYHQTSVSSGIATVSEGSGATGSNAYVTGVLDLNSWTGIGDLSISVRVRAQSEYSGSSSVTQFRMGIKKMTGETIWSYTKYWTYTKDTDWVTLSTSITQTNIQKGGTYLFYWGYRDSWLTDHSQMVSIDYFSISGDKYPEDTLVNNYAGITTKPKDTSFTMSYNHDTDKVGVSYCTSVSVADSLGFGTDSSPIISSAISIGLNPDEDSYYYWGNNIEWNEVDKVKITIEIRDAWTGALISDTPTIEQVYVNEADDDSVGDINPDMAFDAMNLVLDAIGLIPEVGGFISFIGKVYLFGVKYSTQIGENTLTQQSTTGTASSEFNYRGPAYVVGHTLPGDGSTDFKMQFKINPSLIPGTIYRFSIKYDVTMKHVKQSLPFLSQYWYTTESYTTKQYSENFDYIYLDKADTSIVDIDNPFLINAMSLDRLDPSTDIFATKNGAGWYVIVGSSIQVNAVPGYETIFNKIYEFREMEISFWEEGERRFNPSVIPNLTYIQDLSDLKKVYFKFTAVYEQIN